MYIGNVYLKNKVILAPMAGVTDSPFRQLAKEMGCALVYTEMVSAKGAVSAPDHALKIAAFTEKEHPIAIQLFGSDPSILADGAALCARLNPEIIDINMGCPVKKVAGRGEGCALMRDPDKVLRIVREVCNIINIPVSVKIRKGWDESTINAVEVALAAQEGGASAVAVHGRTREQGYSGKADWTVIRQVKKALHVPVIGNGDIRQPEDAQLMLDQTGCDAVMIGRGVMGNLWLIRRTVHYLETGVILPEPTLQDRIALAKRHLEMVVALKGEFIGIREMRKHLAWYLKGVSGAASIRDQVMRAEEIKKVEEILADIS